MGYEINATIEVQIQGTGVLTIFVNGGWYDRISTSKTFTWLKGSRIMIQAHGNFLKWEGPGGLISQDNPVYFDAES
ncbi:unnamed protein product, partial [marine sediment metagenome]